MSKKIYYGSFAIMAFKFGAYAWTSWFLFLMIALSYLEDWWKPYPWYMNVIVAVLFYPPFAAPVILLILGLFVGYGWVTGWRWWNAIGMLIVGAVAFVFPIAIAAGYFKLAPLFGVW